MDFLKYRGDLFRLLEKYKKGEIDDGDFVRDLLKLMADVEYSRLQECMHECQLSKVDLLTQYKHGKSIHKYSNYPL